MRARTRFLVSAWLLAAASAPGVQVRAQVPAPVAERLLQIGPVVDPGATAALLGPRVLEREPYQGVVVGRDVAYGPADRNRLDTFVVPGGPPKPVLVFVHGGAFVAGNKRLGPASPFYDNIGVWAARNGLVGITVTYRLAPQAPWPEGSRDLGSAVGWIHANAPRLGGDPGRIFLFGHSAGAFHVASYLADPSYHRVPGSGLAGVLLLSGVYRITPALVDAFPAYRSYFGTDPGSYPDRSPIQGLTRSAVPLWIGCAEWDPPPIRDQAVALREALARSGRSFTSVEFAKHSHMSEVYSIHTDDQTVAAAIQAFIRSVGGLPPG